MRNRKRVPALLLSLLMLLSCFSAGLTAFAENDDTQLQQIADTLLHATRDSKPEDGAFQTALDLLRDLTPDQLIEVGRLGGALEGAEFWWAGHETLRLNYQFEYQAMAEKAKAYFPSVLQEIAQNVPAYADFVGVMIDAVIAYSYLIGTPTADPAPLSKDQRAPLAIGMRMAALPEEQRSSFFNKFYFDNGFTVSYVGVTEKLDEEKAKDETIGAVKEVIDFFGLPLESWTTVYQTSSSMNNIYLIMQYFYKCYEEAEPGIAALEAFVGVMSALEAPYTQADIDAAQQAYAAVPKTAWALKDDATDAALEKYKAVMTANGLENNEVDLSAYKETNLGKKYELSKKEADSVLNLLDALTGVDQKLGNAIRGLATGEKLVALLGSIAGSNDMLAALLSIGNVKNSLNKDPKFADAAEKMQMLSNEGHNDSFNEYGTDEEGFRIVTWSAADRFTSADFGFEDGDYNGFADAFSACFGALTELLPLLSSFSFKNKLENGVYTVGKYESLIPLLELLDLEVLSSAEFTAEEEAMTFTDTEGKPYTDSVRACLKLLLTPIAKYLDETFLKHPLDSLADLLPKVAYAVESGLLNDTVQQLIGDFAEFGMSVDLTKDFFWDIVEKKLVTGEDETNIDGTKTRHNDVGFDIDHDGEKEAFPITKAQFDELVTNLAGSAKAVVKKSVSIRFANRLGLETHKNKVVSCVLMEAATIVKTSDGKAFFDLLIDSSSMNSLAKKVLKLALSSPKDVLFQGFAKLSPFIIIMIKISSLLEKLKKLTGKWS